MKSLAVLYAKCAVLTTLYCSELHQIGAVKYIMLSTAARFSAPNAARSVRRKDKGKQVVRFWKFL